MFQECAVLFEAGTNRQEEKVLRSILFDVDEDTGAKSICDIMEVPATDVGIRHASGWVAERAGDYAEVKVLNDGVDYGRAKKLSSRFAKIAEHVIREKDWKDWTL